MNSTPELAGRLIYLIGDDVEEAGALAAQLGHFGYTLLPFCQLAEAREAIRERSPTALLANGGPTWKKCSIRTEILRPQTGVPIVIYAPNQITLQSP